MYRMRLSFLCDILLGSSKHNSLAAILTPGFSAGIKFRRMRRQYLPVMKDPSEEVHISIFTGCSEEVVGIKVT
jgi:hypothetical protein